MDGTNPESLSSLRGIEYFNLSHSNLSGRIPSYLERFNLQNLNLSFNNFAGAVAMQGVLEKTNAISTMGNTRLYGGTPNLRLPLCFIQESTTSEAENILSIAWGCCLIGAGSFDSVYEAILNQHEERIAAVKVLNLQNSTASRSFIAESEALKRIRHPNHVKLLTACSSIDTQGNEFKALVNWIKVKRSLEEWLNRSVQRVNMPTNLQKHSDLFQRVNIAIDVGSALDYLHNRSHKPIVHCDLKPINILLDDGLVGVCGQVANF